MACVCENQSLKNREMHENEGTSLIKSNKDWMLGC